MREIQIKRFNRDKEFEKNCQLKMKQLIAECSAIEGTILARRIWPIYASLMWGDDIRLERGQWM